MITEHLTQSQKALHIAKAAVGSLVRQPTEIKTGRAHGGDVSKWNDYFLPPANTPLPLDFMIQRIGYGQKPDEKLNELHAQIQPIPIRGGYHYFSSAVSWEMQADTFLERVTRLGGYHFYACDVETAYNKKSAGFASGAHKWINKVNQETGLKVLLYTNPAVYKDWLLPYGDWMRNYPLWIAQYWWLPSPDKDPGMLGMKRSDWDWYQYTYHGDGEAYGVGSKQFDLNTFNGTPAQMRTYLDLDDLPPPTDPPTEPEPIPVPADWDLILDKTKQIKRAVEVIEGQNPT